MGMELTIYTLDAHDRLVHKGNFTSGRPLVSFLYWGLGKSQIFTYYNHISFPITIREEHIRLTASIIAEARHAFQKQFPGNSMCCCIPASGAGRT